MRCLLPQVMLRRKSTGLLRWNSQFLFWMAVEDHQKNWVSKRKEKILVGSKSFFSSDIDRVCYIKLNSQFLFNLIKKLSCHQTSSVPIKAVEWDDSKHSQSVHASIRPQLILSISYSRTPETTTVLSVYCFFLIALKIKYISLITL